MDLQSYIQLKEACSLASNSQYLSESVDESVDTIWEEVEAFAHALVEEGMDLSDITWDEVREAYLLEFEDTSGYDLGKPKKRENKPYSSGVVGQFQRLGDKMSGNQNRVTKAKEYETSVTQY